MPQLADNHELIMAHVPALDEIPEFAEEQFPSEDCTCSHGDLFKYHEDHTPGVGCERRLCTCFWWSES